jgi:hypothetical protein
MSKHTPSESDNPEGGQVIRLLTVIMLAYGYISRTSRLLTGTSGDTPLQAGLAGSCPEQGASRPKLQVFRNHCVPLVIDRTQFVFAAAATATPFS